MVKMKAFLFVVILSLSAQVHAGTYLEEEQRVIGMAGAPAQSILIKSWYEGDHVKKIMGNTPMSFLINLKSQKVYVVQDDKKVYWKVPSQMYKQMTQASLQAFGIVQNPDGTYKVPAKVFKKTGQKRKIENWQAYEVKIATKLPNDGQVSMWFADGVGLNQSDFVDTLRAAVAGKSAGLEGFFAEVKALHGYPVMSSATFTIQGQHLNLIQQVKVAKKQKMPAGFFAIPKNYKEIDSPMMGPGPQAAPKPAPQQSLKK